MLEELLDYLELFHFILQIIGEDLSFIELLQGSLAKILKKRIDRLFQSYPPSMKPKSDHEFYKREDYSQILYETKKQFYDIIDSVRTNRLMYVQGGGSIIEDIPGELSKMLEKTEFSIQDIRTLRSVPLDRICFTPDLSSYHIILFKCCLSKDDFIRAFSYAQYLDASALMDQNQFYTVMKSVTEIWSNNKATVEFSGALYTLLVSLNEVINGIIDDDIQHSLYKFIEEIMVSHNLSLLFAFDPLLKWTPKPFPAENIKRVHDESIKLLRDGSYAHACIILSSIESGCSPNDHLLDTVKASKATIAEWPMIIQKQARKYLASLGSKMSDEEMNAILLELNDMCNIPSAVFVFSDFICNYYMQNVKQICEPLFLTIEKALKADRTSEELRRMFITICENPIRLLQALKISKCRDQFATILEFPQMSCSLLSAIYDKNSLINSSKRVETMIKGITSVYDIGFDTIDVYINAILAAVLYPQKLERVVPNFYNLGSEEQKTIFASIVCAIYAGNYSSVPNLINALPKVRYETEYTCFIELANNFKKENRYARLRGALGADIAIGSKELIDYSLLFEHIVSDDDNTTRIAFSRAGVRPAQWFAALCSSLFAPLFNDVANLAKRYEDSKDNHLVLVWIGYYAAKRLSNKWLDTIDDECFSELVPAIFFPNSLALEESEKEESKLLEEKYSNAFNDIQSLTKQ